MKPIIDPLSGSWSQFSGHSGLSLTTRVAELAAWVKARTEHDLMPFDRRLIEGPVPWTTVRERNGRTHEGLNFVSSDYLSLALHPAVKQAAVAAVRRYGTHSAGTAALAGAHESADALCEGLGQLLQMPHVSLQPSGWKAGYGAMCALVRPGDTVLLDAQTSSGLMEGARRSTHRVLPYRHLDIDHLALCLQRLRARNATGFIVVATPSLFPTDGAAVDLAALNTVCRAYDALTVVDVAHDLGCIGPGGAGEAGVQGVVGEFDVLVGSLSKTFASSGGFIATGKADLGDYLRTYSPPHTFSTTLSPSQIAAATAALRIVQSPEGAARRAALQRSAVALRAALTRHQLRPTGTPGPIVQVILGCERQGRRVARLCAESGLLVSLLETPLADPGACSLRFQVMAGHEPALFPDVARQLAGHIATAAAEARAEVHHEANASATTVTTPVQAPPFHNA